MYIQKYISFDFRDGGCVINNKKKSELLHYLPLILYLTEKSLILYLTEKSVRLCTVLHLNITP